MEIISPKNNIDFMRLRKPAMIVSGVLVVLALVSIIVRGLSFGIDFTGGYLIEVGYPQAVKIDPLRQALAERGFGDAQVQHFGTSREVLVRLAPREGVNSAQLSDRVLSVVAGADTDAGTGEMRRIEFVGPQVGEHLKEQGGLAVLYALVGILIYVTFRFEKRFALGAVLALVHDVTLTVGVFSLTQLDFDLTVLAAVLAVIGYSLNDTIVVFDRIRENFRRMRKGTPVEIVNASVNQTLTRTVITSGTTLLVLLALFLLGGEVIRNFALALIIGILVGTYSSIFIASPAVLALGLTKQDMMPVQKEGAEADNTP